MIEAVATIGRHVRGVSNEDEIGQLIQQRFEPNKEPQDKVLKIVICETTDGGYSYCGIELTDLKNDFCRRMLYKSFGGNGPNPSPSAQYTDSPEKTVKKKVIKFFEKVADSSEFDQSVRTMMGRICGVLEKNYAQIERDVLEQLPRNRKVNTYVTVVFKQGDEERFVRDMDVFKDIFLQLVNQKESRFEGKGTCSVCGRRGTVLGGVSPYAFFNTDKDGFLVNFNKSESFKNFPICPTCVRDLEAGKAYVERKLVFKFVQGLSYQLIPQPLSNESAIEDVLKIVEDSTRELITANLPRITMDEKELIVLLKDFGDSITLNFLFIKKSNRAEKILALVNDVLPSRLSRIYQAKTSVDNMFEPMVQVPFTFSTIRQFFFKSDDNRQEADLDKYFLQLTDAVLKGTRLNVAFVLEFLIRKIRQEYMKLLQNNQNSFRWASIDGLRVLVFLKKVGTLEVKGLETGGRVYDQFLDRFDGLVGAPLQRGLVLLGAATQLLLQIQKEQRGSQPFLNQLKGLKMDERDFKELLPKLQAKLFEYDSYDRARRLLEEASFYLLKPGRWDISVPEMNFYFALGMNLVWEILKSTRTEEV
ncbi:TIGR02556 family CRISPR-associated protein [Coprothermobacteraceae bacterium]|nr:TIGR02556 family CRISPR-associated protein [Coprothermobacteraceae bacterium]